MKLLRLSLFLSLALISGLAAAAAATREVRDDSGASVRVPADNCRIVSLAPGTTAMLYAAGAGKCLVGTIAHSKEPTAAEKIPVVGDAETLDFENLLALRPTVVVVAVDVVQRVRIDRIRALDIPVYEVHVTSLGQMPTSIRGLGALTATQAAANREAGRLDQELAAIAARYRGRPPVRVLYQIWDQPIYTIGGKHVITDALKLCGAVNVFDELGTAAPAVTREAVVPGASDTMRQLSAGTRTEVPLSSRTSRVAAAAAARLEVSARQTNSESRSNLTGDDARCARHSRHSRRNRRLRHARYAV